jgi:hypothetical protein
MAGSLEIDGHLYRLHEAVVRVGANLVELEAVPARAMLDTVSLDGATAVRWSDGQAMLGQLFGWYASLTALLDAAVAARGTRPSVSASKVATLTELLLGPSVALSDGAIPLAQRDLLSHSRAIARVTPDELLGHMADGYRGVRDVLVDVARAWDELLPRAEVARAEASALAELIDDADRTARSQVDGWITELDELCGRLATDPLSVDAGSLDRIEAAQSRVAGERAAVGELKRRWAQKATAARARLDQLEALVDSTAAQHRETAQRVVGSVPVAVPFDVFSKELAGIEDAARDERWAVVSTELDRWTASVDAATREVQDGAAADLALLDGRRQLRGLLDAYIAKARALGRLEDGEVGPLLATAQDELYQAPADLDRATELLQQVQRALAVSTEGVRR